MAPAATDDLNPDHITHPVRTLFDWIFVHSNETVQESRYIDKGTLRELIVYYDVFNTTFEYTPRRHPRDGALRRRWRHIRARANATRIAALAPRLIPAILDRIASFLSTHHMGPMGPICTM